MTCIQQPHHNGVTRPCWVHGPRYSGLTAVWATTHIRHLHSQVSPERLKPKHNDLAQTQHGLNLPSLIQTPLQCCLWECGNEHILRCSPCRFMSFLGQSHVYLSLTICQQAELNVQCIASINWLIGIHDDAVAVCPRVHFSCI